MNNKKLVFIINVDWYFKLHWIDRARYFQSLGYDIHIITSFTKNKILDELSYEGMQCYNLEFKRNSLNVLREIKTTIQLKKILSDIEPDIIHCITIKPNIYVGLINRIIFRKKIVYSITGLGAVFSSENKKFRFIRKAIQSLYKLVSTDHSMFIFENSEDYAFFEKKNILKHSNGIVIKGAGIDLSLFDKSQHTPCLNILFAARLLEDKGLRILINACKQLKQEGIPIKLLVAGIIDLDVTSAIPMEEINQWNKDGHIKWLGNVKDMPDLIKSSHIICLPTVYGEGVPRILIEGASCQRPIITTNVPGCRELVEHNVTGLLAKPGDVSSLKHCIKAVILDDDNARAIAYNARKKVETEFSQEIVFRRTREVYDRLYDS
ncbi:glycosyltransferase family 4 protein [Vibrio syngnathi]|uniref:N, N'-diacetylbacillosaminyl-diphospho-undecaprenol alpha-1,3-N-acetylgalactosaminyltransferase n=1 Tax=Vibrio syngnathi TaxID=3034029 RepID=A0AA34TQY3_9VIBR|nr:glycosyltransferase family 4 protein [Vibrio syngnathi]ARP39461.1 N,N'-diacetylbacillosaminyl-diphospho-undecaprenol alpha-1,3-N-acetylgalactosaminyltransferase [Vibrio syngnathi]